MRNCEGQVQICQKSNKLVLFSPYFFQCLRQISSNVLIKLANKDVSTNCLLFHVKRTDRTDENQACDFFFAMAVNIERGLDYTCYEAVNFLNLF